MMQLVKVLRITRSWPLWARYSSTVLLVILSLAARLAMGPKLEGYPFLLFYPAIILSGLLFDRGSGIIATLLSSAFFAYFLASPLYLFAVESTENLFALVLFMAVGIFMAVLGETIHVVVGKLEKVRARAESIADERAVLLRELTHRMRNHLATIGSLLRLQARATEEASAKAALITAADRVNVLGRVHERLAIQSGGAVVDSRTFINDLCDDLRAALIGLRPVALDLALEGHPISIQKAVAIGLIINELLTNALKYAFPGETRGTVNVSFARDGNQYKLTVRDNGVGVGEHRGGKGMGISLVRTLASQSGGDLEVWDAQPGAVFVVTLPITSGLRTERPMPTR